MTSLHPGPLLAALALAAGCTSPAESPRALFDEMHRALAAEEGTGGFDAAGMAAQDARYERVVAWYEAGELDTGEDRFWAAAVLVRSDEPAHLVLAETLAASAADAGDPRGLVVVAEARDRQALLLGRPQPYGTQMVYVPVTGTWRLYEVDPRTTDDERAEMGLPPLAELRERARRMDEEPVTDRLGREVIEPLRRER